MSVPIYFTCGCVSNASCLLFNWCSITVELMYVKIKDKESNGNVTLIKIISNPQYFFSSLSGKMKAVISSNIFRHSKERCPYLPLMIQRDLKVHPSQIILFVSAKEVKIVKGLCSPIRF